MSVTVKREGAALDVLQGGRSLLEAKEVVLFTASDLINLNLDRLEEVDQQFPFSLRCDEDAAAADLFHQ